MKNIAFLVMCLMLIGNAVAQTGTPYIAKAEVLNFPEINKEVEVELGENIVWKVFKKVSPAIQLTQEITDDKMSNVGLFVIPAGVLPVIGETEDGRFFNSPDSHVRAFGAKTHFEGGIFVPNDKAKPTLYYFIKGSAWGFGKVITYSTKPVENIELTTVSEIFPESFKRELTYLGVSQNTISVAYREFKGDMIRPAFSQELKFDLSQGDVIGFRGSRFQIIKASNIGLRYKLIKPFD